MDRRELLKTISALVGGVLTAPLATGLLSGCQVPASYTPAVFTKDQESLVAVLVEHIIPATDTPGAREAGVHRFIDKMLAEWYLPEDRAAFLAGLADVDARANAAFETSFVSAGASDQRRLLEQLDAEAYPEAADGSPLPMPEPVPFFRVLKAMTLAGYYTSEIGATQELRMMPMGQWLPDVPYEDIGRAWA